MTVLIVRTLISIYFEETVCLFYRLTNMV